MASSPHLTNEDIARLREFHAHHFRGQAVPNIPAHNDVSPVEVDQQTSSNELGLYEDGVPRTLTEDQILMFRHSEIQRLLQQRRKEREREREQEQEGEKGQVMADRATTKSSTSKLANSSQSLGHDSGRYRTDAAVHHDDCVNDLTYDEEPKNGLQSKSDPKAFVWPKLGS